MKIDGSDWKERLLAGKNFSEKSESEKLFDSLLFFKQLASLFVERIRITKELDCLILEDQTKFTEYLLNTIGLYEEECKPALDVPDDGVAPIPEELQDLYYDKNTTLAQHLYTKRIFILDHLQEVKTLWNDKQEDKIKKKIADMMFQDLSEVFKAKKRIKNDFMLLDNMIKKAIENSPDAQKNEALKKSLEEIRDDFIRNGFDI